MRKTIIFGGSSGIGKAVAERTAIEGNPVLICARNSEKLRKACRHISLNSSNNHIKWKSIDFSNQVEFEPELAGIISDFGIPDRILLNGGGPPFASFEDLSIEQWNQYIFQIFLSNVILLKMFLPRMADNTSIVMILSDVVRNAGRGKSMPCSLRMGLLGLMKCLAAEYANRGIRINAVSPGPVKTGRAKSLFAKIAQNENRLYEEVEKQFLENLPMKRMGDPTEIAALVCFLFSEESGYINGANFICDGGLTAVPM